MQRKVTLSYMTNLLFFEANRLSFALPLLCCPPYEIIFLPSTRGHIDFSPKASPPIVRKAHAFSCPINITGDMKPFLAEIRDHELQIERYGDYRGTSTTSFETSFDVVDQPLTFQLPKVLVSPRLCFLPREIHVRELLKTEFHTPILRPVHWVRRGPDALRRYFQYSDRLRSKISEELEFYHQFIFDLFSIADIYFEKKLYGRLLTVHAPFDLRIADFNSRLVFCINHRNVVFAKSLGAELSRILLSLSISSKPA